MAKQEVKPPKKARKAITKLHKLVEYLEYYMGNNQFFRDHIVEELASDIEDVLHDLSIEKNIDHIKLATKLRTIWAKEQEQQIEEIIEDRIDEEVEKRIEDIKDMDRGDI